MPGVLALDLASTTGWAVSERMPSGRPRSGHWQLQEDRGAGHMGSAFNLKFSDAITIWQPDLVIAEAPLPEHRSAAAAEIAFGLSFLCATLCDLRAVRFERLHNQTLKKWFTGYGRAGKSDMMAACVARGWHITQPDEADAVALLCWAEHHHAQFLAARAASLALAAGR